MGRVTVLVEHAWAMQSSSNQQESIVARPVNKPVDIEPPPRPKQKVPLSSKIRVTVPESVAELVRLYNNCQTPEQRRTCEIAARDVISRLEYLVLSSTIPDTFRNDRIRSLIFPAKNLAAPRLNPPSNMPLGAIPGASARSTKASLARAANTIKRLQSPNLFSMKAGLPDSSPTAPTPVDSPGSDKRTSHEKTIQFVAEARSSVLMLARCRTRHIRDRCMDLLLEALDTNITSSNQEEIRSLQYLWTELVHVFRGVIDDRRSRRANAGSLSITTNQAQLIHPSSMTSYNVSQLVDLALDTKITVDAHLERLLSCLSLTMQRIEYSQDVAHFELMDIVLSSFRSVIEDFLLLRSEDPYIEALISSLEDSVNI